MSNFKPIQHDNSWHYRLYEWLVSRAESIYNLEPLPRPIENPEKVFYERVNEGKRKLQSDKYEL